MARQSMKNRHIRKLGKTGNSESPSYYVTLPIDVIRSLKWKDGQRLVVKKSRNKIVIEDWTE
jgi:antitoxin component of MazEF toxin-antitoxin module